MKLCIATPCHSGQVCVPFAVSLADTIKALTAAGIEVQWRVLSFASFIHVVREKMAREFLATDYTDLLFADDDMGWDVEGILNMIASDAEVVGAICPKKRAKVDWAVNLLNDVEGNHIGRNGLLECSYVGTALMRVKRGVFEQMPGRLFDAQHEGERFIGEDAWFCREWRRLGGRVWADPRVSIIHTGLKNWEGRYADHR